MKTAREINILHEHWQALLTRSSLTEGTREVTAFELLTVATRSRPDYIIVGEIRGEEAYALFQAFGSGHAGASTIHADTIEDVVKRLLTRPMSVPPMLVSLAHVFVRIIRLKVKDQIARRVVEIAENIGIARGGRPHLHYVFKWDPERDVLTQVEESRHLEMISRTRFVSLRFLKEEYERRKKLIYLMAERGYTTPHIVAKIFSQYLRSQIYDGGCGERRC